MQVRWLRVPPQPILGLAGIVLAITAQYAHVFRGADVAAVIFFAGALVCWGAALAASNVAVKIRRDEPLPEIRTRQMTAVPVVSAIGLALLAFLFGSANGFNSDNALAWLGSVAIFLYAFWQPEKNLTDWSAWIDARVAAARDVLMNGIRFSTRQLLLIGVLLLAVFFYFNNLSGVPGELDSPHAEKILDVQQVLNGDRPVYFDQGLEHEPLDDYVTTAFVALTGHPLDFMALKLVGAALGVLLVIGTFLLARTLFEFDVALVATALAAMGKWSVALARDGLAFVYTPLVFTFTLYFLVRALKFQRRNDFMMTGLLLGLGLYGSDVFRIVPILVALFLVLRYIFARPRAVQYVHNSILLFALALVAALPLVRYAIDQPVRFWYDWLARLFGSGQPLTVNSIGLFAGNLVNAALMFNWQGDGSWALNIPGDPALDLVTGALFLLGVAYAVYRVLKCRERIYGFVLIGLAVMLVPSAINLANPDANPSAVFASGAIPFAFVLAALPVVWIARAIDRYFSHAARTRFAPVGVVLLLLAAAALANYARYFVDFKQSYLQTSWNSDEIATAIRGFADSVGDTGHAWIIAYPNWVDARNVGINLGQVGWAQAIQNVDAAPVLPSDNGNKLFVLSAHDQNNLVRLQQDFPNGQPRLVHARVPGHDFVLFYAPGSSTSTELSPH